MAEEQHLKAPGERGRPAARKRAEIELAGLERVSELYRRLLEMYLMSAAEESK